MLQPPKWVQRLLPPLADPRDEPVLFLLYSICVTTVPSAAVVFLGPQWNVIGALHLVCFYALLLPRFVVALVHVTEHRNLFRKGACSTIAQQVMLLSLEPGRPCLIPASWHPQIASSPTRCRTSC